jgi:hypothetical protein
MITPAGWQHFEEAEKDTHALIERRSDRVADIFLREGGELVPRINPWQSWGAEVKKVLGEGT